MTESHDSSDGAELGTPDRTPPNDLPAEQAVLGAMLLEREAIARARETLLPEHFYREPHGLLFRRIGELYDEGVGVDMTTLGCRLKDLGELDTVGGMMYLTDLLDHTPTAANVRQYARIVREKAFLREMLMLGSDLGERTHRAAHDGGAEAVLQWASARLSAAAAGIATAEIRPIGEFAERVFHDLEELHNSTREVRGWRSGYSRLDRALGGFRPGNLYVIGGKTSWGKTTLGLNLLAGIARTERQPVLMFSLEQSGSEIAIKQMSADSDISPSRLNSARLSDEEWELVPGAVQAARDTPLLVSETPGLTVERMTEITRRYRAESGIVAVLVDYAQIADVARRADSEVVRNSLIIRGIAQMARSCGVAAIATSQLNREGKMLPRDEIPDNHHFRESGAIEDAAFVTMFIHHATDDEGRMTGEATLMIRKNRMGRQHLPIAMLWEGQRQLFTEAPGEGEEEPWHQKIT